MEQRRGRIPTPRHHVEEGGDRSALGDAVSSADRQRARRDLADGRTGPASRRRERERQAELLIAEVLSVLSQRDVLVAGLERRAGRCLADIRALGWPSAAVTAQACGISLREASRLHDARAEGDAFRRDLAAAERLAGDLHEALKARPSTPAPASPDPVEAAFVAVSRTCNGCHARDRDR